MAVFNTRLLFGRSPDDTDIRSLRFYKWWHIWNESKWTLDIPCNQWRNWRGHSDRVISADLSGKYRQGKKENGVKKKENWKSEGEKLKMEGGKVIKWKMSRGTFFLFIYSFIYFCFLLFKMPEIWFGSTKMEIFYPISRRGKTIRKNDFAPSENVSCYAPACN